MKRIALLVQYDGSNYSGWQRQKNATAIQEILESTLLKITNQAVNTFAAGRTDAGVHASGQVVHFDIDGVREVFWRTSDNSAYLRALMHADGNIRYANYQNEQQMIEYLTDNGFDESTISEIIA